MTFVFMMLFAGATPDTDALAALALARALAAAKPVAPRDRPPVADVRTTSPTPVRTAPPVSYVGPFHMPAYNRSGGQHTHVCTACGGSWTHSDSNQGKLMPHVCPFCGAAPPGAHKVVTSQQQAAPPNPAPVRWVSPQYCPVGKR